MMGKLRDTGGQLVATWQTKIDRSRNVGLVTGLLPSGVGPKPARVTVYCHPVAPRPIAQEIRLLAAGREERTEATLKRWLDLWTPRGEVRLPSAIGGVTLAAIVNELGISDAIDSAVYSKFREWLQGKDLPPASTFERRNVRDLRASIKWLACALAYSELLDRGSRKPVKETADLLGLTPPDVRKTIFIAREEGFLTPAEHGRSGGSLTPKAERLISKLLNSGGVK